jgi:hypothetical protein
MLSLNLTKDERVAILRVLKGIVVADGELKPEEIALLLRISQRMKASTQEFEDADDLSLLDAAKILNGLTSDEKQFVSACISSTIAIDAEVHPKEAAVGAFIMKMCDLPAHKNLESAFADVLG